MKKILPWCFLAAVLLFRLISVKSVYHNGELIKLTGRVVSFPSRYLSGCNIKVNRFTLFVAGICKIAYGDEITVVGRVILGKGQHHKLSEVKIVNVRTNDGQLAAFRQSMLNFYRRSLPEPYASLVSGITLGVKSDFPGSFWDKLIKTGTAHVVVASGTNVSFVAGGVLTILLMFLPRRKAILGAFAAVGLYAVVCGLEAPVVRAALMAGLSYWAVAAGKINLSGRALILAGFIMLIINPFWFWDIGFWLSFTATSSLILFFRPLKALFNFPPKLEVLLGNNFLTSLAAQIGIAPIIYLTFDSVNIISPIINALVLWTIAPLTAISMVAGVTGLVVPVVGRGILYLAYPLARWFVWVVEITG